MRERCAGGDAGETHGKVDVAAARVRGHVREHGDAEAELEGDGQWIDAEPLGGLHARAGSANGGRDDEASRRTAPQPKYTKSAMARHSAMHPRMRVFVSGWSGRAVPSKAGGAMAGVCLWGTS